MTKHEPMTFKAIIRKCKALCKSKKTVIRIQRLRQDRCADSAWWEEGSLIVSMRIDPAQGGYVPLVIHELLHVVLYDLIGSKFDRDTEETIINGLEHEICNHHLSQAQYREWRKIIEAKLAESREAEDEG